MRWQQEFRLGFRVFNKRWMMNSQGFVFNERTPDSQALLQYIPWETFEANTLPDGLLFATRRKKQDAYMLTDIQDRVVKVIKRKKSHMLSKDWLLYKDVYTNNHHQGHIMEIPVRYKLMDIYTTKLKGMELPTVILMKYIRQTRDWRKYVDGSIIQPTHQMMKSLKRMYPSQAHALNETILMQNLTKRNLFGQLPIEDVLYLRRINQKVGWTPYGDIMQFMLLPKMALLHNSDVVAKKLTKDIAILQERFTFLIAKLAPKRSQMLSKEFGPAKYKPAKSRTFQNIFVRANYAPRPSMILNSEMAKMEFVPVESQYVMDHIYGVKNILDARVVKNDYTWADLSRTVGKVQKIDVAVAKHKPHQALYQPLNNHILSELMYQTAMVEKSLTFMDKKLLPARIEGEMKRAQWEDLIRLYDKWDLLDIPNTDYDYEADKSSVHDSKGCPYHPIGSANQQEVEIKTPVTHPFAQWSEIARKEIWVNLNVYADTVMTLYGLWKKHAFKLGGMRTQAGLTFLLEETRNWIHQQTNDHPEYLRMFRMVRWYAETIVLSLQKTILVRYYEPWVDKMEKGVVHGEYGGFQLLPAGALESTDSSATLTFTQENLIDAEFSFSYLFKNYSGKGVFRCWIDDELVMETRETGIRRVQLPVQMGTHTYRLEFSNGGMGDSVKLSGFKITNCHFLYSETRYEEDEPKPQAMKSCDQLIRTLIHYYKQHWGQDKEKGAMPLKQRKIWIEDGK